MSGRRKHGGARCGRANSKRSGRLRQMRGNCGGVGGAHFRMIRDKAKLRIEIVGGPIGGIKAR